jgi:selenocysteine-specific elongation factor SelB
MEPSIKSVIVGTAGHIDHGKSSLVEALTGTHPDRLEEEKRRGITIDLGFAFLEENGVRFGFVDVPGHERFISNMLAGAAGVDLVLLVIAADESIKPQTREHFDICRLLGVKRGVVALTKSDLVDADTAGLARLEVEEYLRGSFLENAPVIPVSAKTKVGLPELKLALRFVAQQVAGKDPSHYFRLPIDRAFAIKGFGAVVTGTLISGTVAAGDEIELFPSSQRLRVRGVQSGGKTEERAVAGQRTAVNLAGIEHSALRRGMALATPGKFRATRRIDVRLELLPSAPKMKPRSRVHFHSGTSETIAEVHLYDRRELAPGQSALAQLRLQEEALVLAGDRFIVRQFSPVNTIGGGVVLDPGARRPTVRDSGRAEFLRTLERGERAEMLAAMTERATLGLRFDEIVARTGWRRLRPSPQRLERAAAVGFREAVRGCAAENRRALGTIPQRESVAARNNARGFAVDHRAARARGNVSSGAGRVAGAKEAGGARRDHQARRLDDQPGSGRSARQGTDREGICRGRTRSAGGERSFEQAAGGSQARREDFADPAARQEPGACDPGTDFPSRRFGAIARPAIGVQEKQRGPDFRPGFQGVDRNHPQVRHPLARIPGPRTGNAAGRRRACYPVKAEK